MLTEQMSAPERRATISLAGIFFLRMLGLFMILPVFALYAESLERVTPLLIGLAIGIYGLTQAVLQIPFGMLSDRIGRKPVIIAGLLLFALGSLLAAWADDIVWIIVGRAIQGAGAIAAVVMALVADLTREEHRGKAMALIGFSIGISFMVAMIVGPILNHWIGVPGIFLLTALLAVGGIVAVVTLVPSPHELRFHRDTEVETARLSQILRDPQLLRLDFGVLVLHLILTASFVVIPLSLRDSGLAPSLHWQVYLPVMSLAMLLAVPLIIIAEKYRRLKLIFNLGIMLILLSLLALIPAHQHFWGIVLLLLAFFLAFNLLEASLPSLVSKIAPAKNKGTAMGVYSSSQFFGAFIGGLLGGWSYGQFGAAGVFALCAAIVALWQLAALTMREPPYLSNEMVRVGSQDSTAAKTLEQRLGAISGVAQVSVDGAEGIAYLKVERHRLDRKALLAFALDEA
jgi:MFS family permease